MFFDDKGKKIYASNRGNFKRTPLSTVGGLVSKFSAFDSRYTPFNAKQIETFLNNGIHNIGKGHNR